jgi:flagellar basal-body rod protein FlgC
MNIKITIGIFILLICTDNYSYASDPLKSSIKISSSGMQAQQARLRIVAQNIANKDSTSLQPGADPYRRQILVLNAKQDKELGAKKVIIKKYGYDKSDFKLVYNPGHPAADTDGYVKYPNVNMNIENVDSKDTVRNYESNLNMLDLSKTMFNKTLEILK